MPRGWGATGLTLRRRVPTWLRLLLALALLLGVLWVADLPAVAARLRAAEPAWLLASLASSVAANLASSWRWRSMVQWLGHRMGLARATAVYFQAVAINSLLPGAVVGGDVFRVAALRRQGQGLLEAGTSVVLDRLSGLWMVAVMGLLAVATGGAGRLLATWGLPAVPSAVALLLALALLAAPAMALWAAGRGAPGTTRLARMRGLAARPQAGREYLRQALGAAAVQALSVGGWACAARALGLDLPYLATMVAAVPIFLMSNLPISFGGWGTREAAAGLALSAFGVPTSAGVAVAVLVGLLGLVQALAGAVLLVLDRQR